MSSTHATGTITLPGPGLTGKLEVFHAKPNKALQRMSLPGIGDVKEAFDGKVGWSLSPMTGPTLIDGKQLEERAFDGDFYEELKSPQRYTSISTLERTTFEARPVYESVSSRRPAARTSSSTTSDTVSAQVGLDPR